jgi:hypothetical protein
MKKELNEDKTENQSVVQSVEQSSMKVPRSVKKKDHFNAPISKNSSKFNINISLDHSEAVPIPVNNIINFSNLIPSEESIDPEILEFKQLKTEYKKIKAVLEVETNNEEMKKLKKKIKKRMKQIKEKLKN